MMRKTEKSEKSIPQELTMQFTSGCAVFHRVLWPSAGVNERYDNMNKLYLFFSVVVGVCLLLAIGIVFLCGI